MKRASWWERISDWTGWERSPGWIRSGIGTALLVYGFATMAGLPVGYVLAHVSDLIGAASGGRR